MAKFRLARAARNDLEDIWTFIAVDSEQIADEFIDLIIEKFQLLTTQPEMGRVRPELGEGIRSLPIKSYVVFYRINDHIVEIIRVLSGYRDIESEFG